jgi:hypothetical protein
MESSATPLQKLQRLIYNSFVTIKAWASQENSPVASAIA